LKFGEQMTREEKVIWAAGFVDGEGCISIIKNRHAGCVRGYYYTMRVAVSQRGRRPLDELAKLFGGVVRPAQRGSDLFVWVASTQMGADALNEMLPYMIVKKQQAKVAISFANRRIERGYGRRKPDGTMQEFITTRDEKDFHALRAAKR